MKSRRVKESKGEKEMRREEKKDERKEKSTSGKKEEEGVKRAGTRETELLT